MRVRTQRHTRLLTLAAIIGFGGPGGCYSGVDGHAGDDPALSGGGQDGGDAGDDAGDDGADDGDPAGLCGEGPNAAETPLRRLTRAQYDHVVRDLIGVDMGLSEAFVSDEKIATFDANAIASVTELGVEQYMDAAEIAATAAVQDLDTLLPCDPMVDDEDACALQFIETFGRRAYRRPLTSEQIDDAFSLFSTSRETLDFAESIRLVVQGLLQSPYFLYHLEEVEAGSEGQLVELSPFEVASRLSFFLWESMPDDELLDVAEAGQLATAEQVRAQAERMIDDERASDTIRHFHAQWLAIEGLEFMSKDAKLYGEFSPALAADMREEVERFADHVIREDDARLETLMTANYTVANAAIAELYGVTGPASGWGPVDLPASERSGLLTLSGVMTAHSHDNQTSPVLRGVLVRQNFFCQTPAQPPDNVNDNPPGLDPTLPTKERFDQHRTDPTCSGCHELMDPLGYGFEHYDAMGRWRTQDGNFEVDATGHIVGTDVDGEYDGPVELTQILTGSEQARQCVATQWFRYALGRIEGDADECAIDGIYADFAESDFDIRELMIAIAVSDSVRHLRVSTDGNE